jgi:DNA-binding response OmpR family regulator
MPLMGAIVVAVFNTSEDTTDMLRLCLENAGYVVVTAFTNALRDGNVDLDAFMRQHRPAVVVYDIALPYDANWRLFEHIKAAPSARGVQFVLTSTNAAQVRKVAGNDQDILEIVGKPYDLGQLIASVGEAALRPEKGFSPTSPSDAR